MAGCGCQGEPEGRSPLWRADVGQRNGGQPRSGFNSRGDIVGLCFRKISRAREWRVMSQRALQSEEETKEQAPAEPSWGTVQGESAWGRDLGPLWLLTDANPFQREVAD